MSTQISFSSDINRMLKNPLQHETNRQVDHQEQSEWERQRLENACAEFESLFIYSIMKQMRKTIPKTELTSGGKGEEIFTSMLDEELSKQISLRQGLGLRGVLIEQLTGTRVKEVAQGIVAHTYDKVLSESSGEPLLTLPAEGSISSTFGWRDDPFTGEKDFHTGVDIATPFGSKVYAAEAGRIIFSGWKEGYGEAVEIEHENGLHTLYAHNAKSLVKEGQRVTKNQVIALVGSSGRSTGPHLHYEVRKGGKPINPTQVTLLHKGRWYAQKS